VSIKNWEDRAKLDFNPPCKDKSRTDFYCLAPSERSIKKPVRGFRGFPNDDFKEFLNPTE
jgi:hypothetical protein